MNKWIEANVEPGTLRMLFFGVGINVAVAIHIVFSLQCNFLFYDLMTLTRQDKGKTRLWYIV